MAMSAIGTKQMVSWDSLSRARRRAEVREDVTVGAESCTSGRVDVAFVVASPVASTRDYGVIIDAMEKRALA